MSDQSLPEKPSGDEASVELRRKGPRKDQDSVRRVRVEGKFKLKPKMPKDGARRTPARKGNARPATEQVGLKAAAEAPEQYVRFRMRVDNGELSVLDSHLVDSTLVAPAALYGNFAYEVTNGQRRLHADSIPDLGVTRSFSNLKGPPEERAHNITELSSYEFDIRIPAKELRRAALPKITIALYRVKAHGTSMTPGAAPLNVQFERELRDVAHRQGIPSDKLPKSMQPQRRRRTNESRRKDRE